VLSLDNPSAVLNSSVSLQDAIRTYAKTAIGKRWSEMTKRDLLIATSLAVRERLVDGLLQTQERYRNADAKALYYLSMEFLVGRSLGNNLLNLGLLDLCAGALKELGVDLDELRETEPDAALGNGGLGRLAACFLDSLATLGMPAYGYGINYEYGLFRQEIIDGSQGEKPDRWRRYGSPWLIDRPDEACLIPVYGRIETQEEQASEHSGMWVDRKVMVGVPADLPIVGFGGQTINYLRLYSAASNEEFDIEIFNRGDYIAAVESNIAAQRISKVLYPSDSNEAGRELRLVQEYFLVACAIRDIVRRYNTNHTGFEGFPSKVAIQLNDTHPALAVAELMRMLTDESDLPWDDAWQITQNTFGFTNHTLMPEALERWPIALFERVLPRHLMIIREIDRRLCDHILTVWPGDHDRVARMSIIESEWGQIRMGHLAIAGSHSVNGVAKLHSELIKTSLVPDFYQLWPEKFNNKTNGVTPRRWLLKANPGLASLINRAIGEDWIVDLERLRALEEFSNDSGFHDDFRQVKRKNKHRLARIIHELTAVRVSPDSIFDVQVKRMHEYKRQLLNLLHVIHRYLAIVDGDAEEGPPRTYIFGGKAAPGYLSAKGIIKLINNVAMVINEDPRACDRMKVVFIPDYRVSLAERIIPAADLSEQISTAGMEASGTGNMKFAMNGALTIGTLDGANIEIMEEVGAENIYIFGLKAEEISSHREAGTYNPREVYEQQPEVRRVMDALKSDLFCPHEPGLFTWLFDSLINYDYYFHLADFPAYIQTQDRVSRHYVEPWLWTQKAILNVARIGKFSSDRTVAEYAREIWDLEAV
jgi:starch phosphorylase